MSHDPLKGLRSRASPGPPVPPLHQLPLRTSRAVRGTQALDEWDDKQTVWKAPGVSGAGSGDGDEEYGDIGEHGRRQRKQQGVGGVRESENDIVEAKDEEWRKEDEGDGEEGERRFVRRSLSYPQLMKESNRLGGEDSDNDDDVEEEESWRYEGGMGVMRSLISQRVLKRKKRGVKEAGREENGGRDVEGRVNGGSKSSVKTKCQIRARKGVGKRSKGEELAGKPSTRFSKAMRIWSLPTGSDSKSSNSSYISLDMARNQMPGSYGRVAIYKEEYIREQARGAEASSRRLLAEAEQKKNANTKRLEELQREIELERNLVTAGEARIRELEEELGREDLSSRKMEDFVRTAATNFSIWENQLRRKVAAIEREWSIASSKRDDLFRLLTVPGTKATY